MQNGTVVLRADVRGKFRGRERWWVREVEQEYK
jgi:hypothetical protein